MARISIKLVTPGKIVLHLFALTVVLCCGFATITGMVSHIDLKAQETSDVFDQAKAIKRRIAAGEDELQMFFLPEGPFLTNMFYGTSLVNLSLSHPEDVRFKQESLHEIEQILTRVKRYRTRVPFSLASNSLPGGIIYSGNVNRLMAGYVLLGGKDEKIIEEFHKESENIHRAFLSANPPFPESFGGLTWPVDGVPALDSLRLHDVLFATSYSDAIDRWLTWLKSHMDRETQLMIAQAGKTDSEIIDGTRGCAMSWSLALLPSIDPAFAAQQYQIFRQQWFVPFGGGLLGIREWYNGKEKPSDFKVGPVVGGVGAAATGLGIAAARANSDWESWNKFLRGLETLGCPLHTIYGEKSYFFAQTLLCDSIALWGKTIVPWHADPPQNSFPEPSPDEFTFVIGIVGIITMSLAVVLLVRIASLIRKPDYTRVPLNKVAIAFATLQILLFGLWLFVPLLSWMQIILIMAIVDLIEEMTLRPKIVAEHFRALESSDAQRRQTEH